MSSRTEAIKYIHANIDSKLVTDEDRFNLSIFIGDRIGYEKIYDKGSDCALYIRDLQDDLIFELSTMIKEVIEKNKEKVKNMYT